MVTVDPIFGTELGFVKDANWPPVVLITCVSNCDDRTELGKSSPGVIKTVGNLLSE